MMKYERLILRIKEEKEKWNNSAESFAEKGEKVQEVLVQKVL